MTSSKDKIHILAIIFAIAVGVSITTGALLFYKMSERTGNLLVGFDSELNIVPIYQIVNYIVNYSIINLDVSFELSH